VGAAKGKRQTINRVPTLLANSDFGATPQQDTAPKAYHQKQIIVLQFAPLYINH